MPWRASLYPLLPGALAQMLGAMPLRDASRLTEIRVRLGQPVRFVFVDGWRTVGGAMTDKQMDELLGAPCRRARYAYEAQLAQGFIPLEGGHRAGVCGRVVYENGHIARMSGVKSVCIRIARRIDGASRPIQRYLFAAHGPSRVLVLGPPGSGKTTVLRDAARYLSAECGVHVAAADEREELFADGDSCAVDVLSGARKADAVRMLVRSMAPQLIVTDEIGCSEDTQALLEAASSGVGLLASAHASCWEDLLRRPALRSLFEYRTFDWYILLGPGGTCLRVYGRQGPAQVEGMHGELGSGGDGDDRNQRDRVSACGWRGGTPEMGPGDAQMPDAPERRHPL